MVWGQAGIIGALRSTTFSREPHESSRNSRIPWLPHPDAWVQAALADQETLLIDHKNCEFKAASTALSLIAKYHSHVDLINLMSRLAREELVHHEQVMRLMKKRKIGLRQLSAGRYASGLRKVVRSHEPVKLVDTLVVGAFIEARSCERFEALVPHLDEELGKFYFGLLKSEARHFKAT